MSRRSRRRRRICRRCREKTLAIFLSHFQWRKPSMQPSLCGAPLHSLSQLGSCPMNRKQGLQEKRRGDERLDLLVEALSWSRRSRPTEPIVVRLSRYPLSRAIPPLVQRQEIEVKDKPNFRRTHGQELP